MKCEGFNVEHLSLDIRKNMASIKQSTKRQMYKMITVAFLPYQCHNLPMGPAEEHLSQSIIIALFGRIPGM